MIIYGSKMYGVKNIVKGVGTCPHCGAYDKHKSYDGRKWGHLYWIPIIPEGKPVRVMKECAKCSMGSHLPQTQIGELYRNIERLMEPCILAAGEGRHSFHDDQGTQVFTGPFLMDAVDLMYCAGYGSEIQPLIDLLNNDASRYAYHIARGAYHEIQGHTAEALADYQSANAAAPDIALPYLLLADFHARAGRSQEQLDMLDKAISLEPDNVQLLLVKVNPLEQLGRFQEIIDLLDQAERLVPELANDKNFKKHRKKYAKKAAKSGR